MSTLELQAVAKSYGETPVLQNIDLRIDLRVRRAAETLQLTALVDRQPKALSGGQWQRVAIVRAICRKPKVFLFDEPLSNRDASLRVATRLEIARLNRSLPDATMTYVTHDQIEAMTLADRIVVLAGGGSHRLAPRWRFITIRPTLSSPCSSGHPR